MTAGTASSSTEQGAMCRGGEVPARPRSPRPGEEENSCHGCARSPDAFFFLPLSPVGNPRGRFLPSGRVAHRAR